MKAKRRYVPDLSQHIAVCEANFVRLCRLLPDSAATDDLFEFAVGPCGNVAVRVEVKSTGPYTRTLSIQQDDPSLWVRPAAMTVQLYLDMRLAEVIEFQAVRRPAAVHDYPNSAMLQPDEKVQWNRFLADWLQHCLDFGHARLDSESLRGVSKM